MSASEALRAAGPSVNAGDALEIGEPQQELAKALAPLPGRQRAVVQDGIALVDIAAGRRLPPDWPRARARPKTAPITIAATAEIASTHERRPAAARCRPAFTVKSRRMSRYSDKAIAVPPSLRLAVAATWQTHASCRTGFRPTVAAECLEIGQILDLRFRRYGSRCCGSGGTGSSPRRRNPASCPGCRQSVSMLRSRRSIMSIAIAAVGRGPFVAPVHVGERIEQEIDAQADEVARIGRPDKGQEQIGPFAHPYTASVWPKSSRVALEAPILRPRRRHRRRRWSN